MHPVLREAESGLRLAANSYADPDRLPALVDLSQHRNEYRGEEEFSVQFSDRRFTRWSVPWLEIMNAPPWVRSSRALLVELREMWERLRIERRQELIESARWTGRGDPPAMIAPPNIEEMRRELLQPGGFVEFYDGPRRRPRREITTSNVAPIEPPPLTLDAIQRTMEMARWATVFRPWRREPHPPCECPACNPNRHHDAITKSIALLREWLSPAQLAQYDKGRCFDLTGSAGRRYRIHYGIVGNVNEYDESGQNIIAQLCFQPQGMAGAYVGDTMLAQKVMLENDEPAARAVANISAMRAPIAPENMPPTAAMMADLVGGWLTPGPWRLP